MLLDRVVGTKVDDAALDLNRVGMLEELLHLPALTRRKYSYTCLKSLGGFLIFPHLVGSHEGSDNRSEEQPNKLPQGSKLAESSPYHDLRNRRYSLVRSTLRIRDGLGKKDAPGHRQYPSRAPGYG